MNIFTQISDNLFAILTRRCGRYLYLTIGYITDGNYNNFTLPTRLAFYYGNTSSLSFFPAFRLFDPAYTFMAFKQLDWMLTRNTEIIIFFGIIYTHGVFFLAKSMHAYTNRNVRLCRTMAISIPFTFRRLKF